MRGNSSRNLLFAGATLILFGIIRLFLEQPVEKHMEANHYRDATLNLAVRDKVGQLGFAAALGGFRSLVASMLSIEAFNHWDRDQFDQATTLYWMIVKLQPRTYFNWWQGICMSSIRAVRTARM